MKKIYLSLSVICAVLTSAMTAQNDPGLTAGDIGSVDFPYLGNTITYVTVRAEDGNIWLQQNLGSTATATSVNDAAAYGERFQWGRWDDGHQVAGSATAAATTLSANNPSGLTAATTAFYTGVNPDDWWGSGNDGDSWSGTVASATNGIDPCTAFGPGWHMPSITEWAEVLMEEGISNTATGFSSNLKLTAAGSREGIFGNVINAGSSGSYWASTVSGPYAKDVTILNDGINGSDDAYRSYGMSVRCMNSTCTGVIAPDSIMGAEMVCEGSSNTYMVTSVPNAETYEWHLPVGWSMDSGLMNSITLVAGATGGAVGITVANDCGSVDLELPVLVNELPAPEFSVAGNVFTTGPYDSYQWYYNGNPIAGAEASSYMATENGLYFVVVSDDNGCSNNSETYNFTGVGLNESVLQRSGFYPNPANDILNINASQPVNISIYDVQGKMVINQSNRKQVDTSVLAAGLYQLKLTDINGHVILNEKLSIVR